MTQTELDLFYLKLYDEYLLMSFYKYFQSERKYSMTELYYIKSWYNIEGNPTCNFSTSQGKTTYSTRVSDINDTHEMYKRLIYPKIFQNQLIPHHIIELEKQNRIILQDIKTIMNTINNIDNSKHSGNMSPIDSHDVDINSETKISNRFWNWKWTVGSLTLVGTLGSIIYYFLC